MWTSVFAVVLLVLFGSPVAASAAPPNDDATDPQVIRSLPASVGGTTKGASSEKRDPRPVCAVARRTVWYVLQPRRTGPILVRFRTREELNAVIAVYRNDGSRRVPVACNTTDVRGATNVAFYARKGARYSVLVGERRDSVAGAFVVRFIAAERAPRPPGVRLPVAGIRSTVHPLLDASDAWSLTMERGATYRINLSSSACLALAIFRPGVYSFNRRPARYLDCGGYTVFTPGADGGGRYSLVVESTEEEGPQAYRLSAAPAGPDDGAPGIRLENGKAVSGAVSARDVDRLDVYRFAVSRFNQLTTIDLRVKPDVGLDLLLLNETGARVKCACEAVGRQRLRVRVHPGHYYAVVRSQEQSGGRYALEVLVRDVTTTDVTISGAHFLRVAPEVPVVMTVRVSSVGAGGPAQLTIDRFDPLTGWHFYTLYNRRLGPSGIFSTSWTPPYVGYWRAHARFFGTRFTSFSESRWARLHVSEPLG